ncbi:DNA-binding transcriptional LysR family regulator [Rhodococcus sp. 27YEA15]|uniref:LysR family transcriptional regulator n=1 Tax=Rhodococcus sp. 27YEA15 TaxID=3156259 RepID=UPI003C7E8BEE
MELRQLKYFLVVAEELHFGRAATRLLIAGPSLSQQIMALERDLRVQLFDRDRRSVALTPAGAALLPHVRALLERADDLRHLAERLSGAEPIRIGYVNWIPPDLSTRASGIAQLHVDAWVAPSHAQASRVGDGSLDLAVCWVQNSDLARHGLQARLLGADELYAVSTGSDTAPVSVRDVTLLVDDDQASWSSWNDYALHLAHETGAPVLAIDDGGVTGSAFFDHVRSIGRPVLNCPKGQTTPLPPDLVRRPVVDPTVFWTWSLVWRSDETRPFVLAAVDAITRDVGDLGLREPRVWLPADDPYR